MKVKRRLVNTDWSLRRARLRSGDPRVALFGDQCTVLSGNPSQGVDREYVRVEGVWYRLTTGHPPSLNAWALNQLDEIYESLIAHEVLRE